VPRVLEITIASVGLVVLSPMLLLVACAILLLDGSPVLYRAKRVGLRGREFELLKFRTMSPHADNSGVGLTTHNDPRITCVGRFLRRFKLDEFPQIVNVLRGEMSFVGPRPEDPRYVALYSDQQRWILEHRPGITSPASLEYRNEASLLAGDESDRLYVQTILPHKLSIDMQYQLHRTMLSDLRVIFRTIIGVAR
jgi:lipopolysaccharide/colanic/teichoic acid biosynthesis glycosyltransferase